MNLSRFSKTTMLVAAVLISSAAFSKTVLLDRIVARINNEIITQRQYDRNARRLRAQLARRYSGQELQSRYDGQLKNLLRDMIDRDLLVEKAQDDDIDVSDAVLLRLDQIRRQYGANSLSDLRNMVEGQGLNWEDFRNSIRRSLMMQRVIAREVGSDIIVSKAEAQAYFNAHKAQFEKPAGVHLAELMVSTQNRSEAQADAIAQKALQQLREGKPWEKVVSEYSDDSSAANGGDIGFFKTGTINPTIAAPVAKLNAGQHTGIIKTKYGDVIIELIERSLGGTPQFTDVESQVDNYLYDTAMEAHLRGYLYKLRQESFIRLAPGFIDTGNEPPLGRTKKKARGGRS